MQIIDTNTQFSISVGGQARVATEWIEYCHNKLYCLTYVCSGVVRRNREFSAGCPVQSVLSSSDRYRGFPHPASTVASTTLSQDIGNPWRNTRSRLVRPRQFRTHSFRTQLRLVWSCQFRTYLFRTHYSRLVRPHQFRSDHGCRLLRVHVRHLSHVPRSGRLLNDDHCYGFTGIGPWMFCNIALGLLLVKRLCAAMYLQLIFFLSLTFACLFVGTVTSYRLVC